jgi:polar amino acid transport system permease protein
MRLVNIWFEPIEILSFTALVYILFVFVLSLMLNRVTDRLRARYG